MAAILFAYVTNRTWVFESKARGAGEIFLEMVRFFGARGVSFLLDLLCMYVGVDLLPHPPTPWMKLFANILVIIANYVFSKLFVFRPLPAGADRLSPIPQRRTAMASRHSKRKQEFEDLSSYSSTKEYKKNRRGSRARLAAKIFAGVLSGLLILVGGGSMYVATHLIGDLTTTNITKDPTATGHRPPAWRWTTVSRTSPCSAWTPAAMARETTPRTPM